MYWNDIFLNNEIYYTVAIYYRLHILLVYLIKTTYSDLYNSVSTPVHIVDSLYSKINKLLHDSHETRQPHITNCDVRTEINGMKSEKSNGFTDLTSDSLINGINLLFKPISNVFTIMLQHSYAPIL